MMLKRIGMAAAVLLVGALVFAQESADKGASPKTGGGINTTWEWTSIPKGKIGTDMTTFKKPYEIPATSGSGAKFEVVSGAVKFKTENGVTALYHDNKSSATFDTIEKDKKCEYAITISDAATIELTVTGNGTKAASRIVVVKSGDETVLSVNNLSQDEPAKTLTLTNAPAGTYRVLVNGARIISVKAHN